MRIRLQAAHFDRSAWRSVLPKAARRRARLVAIAIASLACTPLAAHAQDAYLAPDPCFYRSTMYGDGSSSCQHGLEFQCVTGSWESTGAPCSGESVALVGPRPCAMNGVAYQTGDSNCVDGMHVRCEDGVWRGNGTACAAPSAAIQLSSSRESCRYEAITVSTGSSVCQMGTTYLCTDGQWVNLGTMCR